MTDARARTTRVVLLVMIAVLVGAGLYVAVGQGRQYLANRDFHEIAVPAATAVPADAAGALSAVTGSPAAEAGGGVTSPAAAPVPTATGIKAALAAELTAPGLGPSVSAQVYDATTARALLDQGAANPVQPASTSKLLTAAALLTVRRASDRFSTKVVAGAAPGTVVLVGGGDPTLSAAGTGTATEYAEAARISDLAAQVKKSVAGAPVNQVVVDGSLFTGPETATGWAIDDAPSSYASPITATMVDGGRDTPGAQTRSPSPDLAAAKALADALGGATISRGHAPVGAKVLGSVRSAPVGTLVEEMLSESDNVIAEVLTRQIAIATKKPASFTGGAAAVSATLSGFGIPIGSGMKDGSGLSAQDRVPAGVLGQVLLKAVDPKHPELHAIIAAMSVAGWDGTLVEQGRFSGAARNAAGVVRAKTGSLTGVSAIAGVVTDADGRLLVFSFVADQVPGGDVNSPAARNAFDSAVSALAACGCRS
ncbi:MAG: hypothetical protein QOD87_2033 [Pseudonocardiales bacterium]|nr:hypothetical protein [Pseudonocardiales bacterium]